MSIGENKSIKQSEEIAFCKNVEHNYGKILTFVTNAVVTKVRYKTVKFIGVEASYKPFGSSRKKDLSIDKSFLAKFAYGELNVLTHAELLCS